ncbi:MAG: ABC transporter permease [Acidobacteriota bacterium]|jgi:ABC-2 type transport system permease protein|nr:ABC transporter permease [Acidobacteriota bacterium]
MNWRRTRAMARKEFLHILRDARSLILALMLPLVMLLAFGYALSLDVDRVPVTVCDRDRTPASRELVSRFDGSRYFEVVSEVESPEQVDREIDRGRAAMALVIPGSYAKDLAGGREDGDAEVQLIFDGSDSNTAAIALGYADALVQGYALQLRAAAEAKLSGRRTPAPVGARTRVWYNSELESKNYIVPGLVAVILMIIAALLTSLTIAREWETGTMEQLLSTPVRPSEMVLGKLSAYFALGLCDMAVCLVAGVFVFGVPLRGSFPLLLLSCGVFLFGALSWGVMLSASTRSQMMAFQAGVLTSFLPAFLLSGFIYSIQNMPAVIRAVTYVIPARYFITILKGVFLKGVGVEVGAAAVAAELAFLALYAAAVFVFATRKLRGKIA